MDAPSVLWRIIAMAWSRFRQTFFDTMILIQAVFTCMIEHRCMVPIIKWFYNSPDNSTIKIIKVTLLKLSIHVENR
jgi:hypothetical protein